MRERIKELLEEIFHSRLFVIGIVFALLPILLIQRLFTLQIVNGAEYMDSFELRIERERLLPGIRGTIYDRNGVPLAYNELAYNVTIEDNGTYETDQEKNHTLNGAIYDLINIIEEHGGSIDNSFSIYLDGNGEYQFSVADTQLMRFRADIYGHAKIEDLKPTEGTASAEDIIDYLCSDSRYGLYNMYNGSPYEDDLEGAKANCAYTDEEKLKIVTVRYAMDQNRYQRYLPTTVATDVSDETVAVIMENLDSLQGVDISQDTVRVYDDSKYFSLILGYTGKGSAEEIEALQEENEEYTTSDIIGKSGIEQYMETTLRGHNGSETMFVNNMGKVLEITDRTEPTAGSNVYLSIDADLQKAAYDILEQKIAGILISKLENTKEYNPSENSTASDIKIPIYDVYYALINNNILQISDFQDENATDLEKSVYQKFLSRQEQVLSAVRALLSDSQAAAYKDSTSEQKEYMSYIVNELLTANGVIDSGRVDTSDETYVAWRREETINIYAYLNYTVSMNWVDTSKFLDEDTQYLDAGEVYEALVQYIVDELSTDVGFDKLIYKYMIQDDLLTGREICLLLFDQRILNYDDEAVSQLESGQLTAYDFLKEKIRTLEITPAQLALDPCSGSVVIVDPRSGELLALVSYPGYDNNRLANTVDAEYFAQLTQDLSSPFYNHATQERTAPGSTFKPVSAAAGLEEGVITPEETIETRGIFEEITPSPRCWIYTSSHGTHGTINVTEAIRHSCNYFFYEVGYRLGRLNQLSSSYNSDLGLNRLRKYAEMFGLTETTGLEIPESSPQFSSESAVHSAIGQGNHAYTTAQLARYVAAIANGGTVYDLSLISKVTDSSGNMISENSPQVYGEAELSPSTWNCIQTGMYEVIENMASYSEMAINVAGKTGTAQQTESRPNHALFIGYAPYESPELAVSCRISFGYTSSNAAEVCRDIFSYYFGLADRDTLITGEATQAAAAIGD